MCNRFRLLTLAHDSVLLQLPHPVEPIQREILRLDGLSTLSKLLSVSRLDHGENQAVCLAARVIGYLVGIGMCALVLLLSFIRSQFIILNTSVSHSPSHR